MLATDGFPSRERTPDGPRCIVLKQRPRCPDHINGVGVVLGLMVNCDHVVIL